jgi:superfamily II DNA or RNA helicase
MCARQLSADWHADHVIPYVQSGRTNVHELQALCRECNLRKGSMSFRKHQMELFSQLCLKLKRGERGLAVHVTPGGGKSALPVIATHLLRAQNIIDKVCVVVPRLSLRRQGAGAFLDWRFRSLLGHGLEIMEAGNDLDPSRGTAGYITMYQAMSADAAGIHCDEFARHRYLLVLDEAHHVAEDSHFHHALAPLWSAARFRIAMTGTLDRNEGEPIAFLDYSQPDPGGNLLPDVDIYYGLSDAIREKAIIPITFHHIDGELQYIDRRGQHRWLATLNGEERDGIYAAINTRGYADRLLDKCVASWREHRRTSPRSHLLVVCASIPQAKCMQKSLHGMDVQSAIATSDDADAQEVIRQFREADQSQALVTVQMAYEGMDVPALTHLACLTHIRSHPWLMQMFARIMRFDERAGPWEAQHCHAWVPDDDWMQGAIEYIRQEQALGVAVTDASQEGDRNGCHSDDADNREDAGCITPLGGQTTRARASGLNSEEDLDYAQTATINAIKGEYNIEGSPLAIAKMLRHFGVDLSHLEPVPPPSQPGVSVTAKERVQGMRRWIQQCLAALDRAGGHKPGTMNRRCFVEAQQGKPREAMSEDELAAVCDWVARQMKRAGLPDVPRY